MKIHLPKKLIYPFAIALFVICIAGCEKRFNETKFLMSTIVEITAIGSKNDCQDAIEMAFNEIIRIDGLMNFYNEGSEISQINRAAGSNPIKASADTLEVIGRSLKYAALTNGALDITIAPLMELWGFSSDSKHIPSDDQLAAILPLVNHKKVTLDEVNSTVKLESLGMKMNVSGIAKGYAVDKAVEVLKNAGIQNALVNAGGDIYAMGAPPGRDSWRVGIQHPRNSAELLGAIKLKDKAIATSGDYENFFMVDGKRYCHIMDAKTGQPVTGIMSVTIIAENTAEADALATAVFPLGAEGGMKLIENLQDVDGIIIAGMEADNMEILVSSGIRDKVDIIGFGNN